MSDLANTYSVSLSGLRGTIVEVQTHVGTGLVGTTLVGLPDASLREAKERVRAALSSCGVPALNRRVTVNLSPADLPKTGSGFDLAIAVSMLTARQTLPADATRGLVFIGELGLDGMVRPVLGALPAAIAALDSDFVGAVVAPEMAAQARLVEGLRVYSCRHLGDILSVFHPGATELVDVQQGWEVIDGRAQWARADELSASEPPAFPGDDQDGEARFPHSQRVSSGGRVAQSRRSRERLDVVDMADVLGQSAAVEALGIAAAGGHHCLLTGSPGIGKSMLAKRLAALLPDLSRRDSLEVTALHSLVDGSGGVSALRRRPPVEEPHHSATLVSLIGGGSPIRPGAVSLAHAGVLVLDEAPEFHTRALDALRQPLEQGIIAVHRAQQRVVFPARFQMVMTANPCPCGGNPRAGEDTCRCSHTQRSRYWARISGPLLDRIDVRLFLERPHRKDLLGSNAPTSDELRVRVAEARRRAEARWKDLPWSQNSAIPGSYLRSQEQALVRGALERAVERGSISLRGADRVMRLAWSVADWVAHSKPTADDVVQAFELRGADGALAFGAAA